MSDTAMEAKAGNPKADEWAERIAAQQRSGISVKQFCKEHGLTEYSFYAWRKRLQEKGPVRFALVERSARRQRVFAPGRDRRQHRMRSSQPPESVRTFPLI